jgi:hypothetical protein
VRWDATLYKEGEQALFPHERSCSESTFVRMSRNRSWRVNNGVHAARARAAARQHCDMNTCFEHFAIRVTMVLFTTSLKREESRNLILLMWFSFGRLWRGLAVPWLSLSKWHDVLACRDKYRD